MALRRRARGWNRAARAVPTLSGEDPEKSRALGQAAKQLAPVPVPVLTPRRLLAADHLCQPRQDASGHRLLGLGDLLAQLEQLLAVHELARPREHLCLLLLGVVLHEVLQDLGLAANSSEPASIFLISGRTM